MLKRLSFALVALALSCAGASASTFCVISEYSFSLQGGLQIAPGKPLKTPQNISTSVSSAQSSALSTDTKTVRLWCDTQSAFEEGTNPTASATVSVPLSAGSAEYFTVTGGDIIAFILR